MRQLLLMLTTFVCIALHASDSYPVHTIPEPLLKNADRVVRLHETRFDVLNDHEAIFYERTVTTLLRESAEEHAQLVIPYGKLYKVTGIEGAIYDATGKLVRKLKSKEVRDISSVDDISLIDDSRVKLHNFNPASYPCTIEYEVTMKFNTTFFFPSWVPVQGEHVSVEHSAFTVTAPQDYEVRHKSFQYNGQPDVKLEKGKRSWNWQVHALPAIERPFAAPRWDEMTPSVHIAPSKFYIEGYSGSLGSWEDLGKFQLTLNAQRDQLPESLVQKIKSLTKDAATEEERISILYHFLQKNTRYISIQLGIGGWQPFEASFVAEKGYGDCKALSNYMYSLLKAAGIKSYYSLVHGGRSKDDHFLMEDFASNQFNHIILCVPTQKDTMWLECTSQSDAPGYMGSFTGDRKAVLITETGGKLVSTPRYGLEENLQLRHISGEIDANGILTAHVRTNYKAIQQDDLQQRMTYYTKDRMLEYLNKRFSLPTYEVVKYNYNEIKSKIPELHEDIDMLVSNYATITGKRLFIVPNLLNQEPGQLSAEQRTVDIDLAPAYRDIDTVAIDIPKGYEIESLPEPVTLKTKFGSYDARVSFADGKLLYIRKREQFAGRFPASEYAALSQFVNAVYKADRNKLVLVKK